MKKIFLVLIAFIFVAVVYWLFTVRLDYRRIVFVLPSSERAASPYYYKKDGDFFLADDLRIGLEKIGYKVEYRFREDYDDLKLGNAGNVIYFKGYYNFEHLPGVRNDRRKRVLYVYYVEGLNPAILSEVDIVACASQKLLAELQQEYGIEGFFLPQFTNPERFKPAQENEIQAYKVLFVGSNHTGKGRMAVDYALKAGDGLAVFGKFWEKHLEPSVLKGMYIDNEVLYQYYSNAPVVLNDHRSDMRYYGFISNRIYDVTASGGFILTDYMPEIEAIYGNSVAMYKNFEEFKFKLSYYLTHPKERQMMSQKARQITLQNFTHEIAAKKFDAFLKNMQK